MPGQTFWIHEVDGVGFLQGIGIPTKPENNMGKPI